MTPLELFHEARLTEALEAQRAAVEAKPDDPAERLTLAEFLTFAGHRTESRIHLDAIPDPDDDLAEYLDDWRQLLAADAVRHAGGEPAFLLPLPEYFDLRHAAFALIAAGDEEALETLANIEEIIPHLDGHVDGRPFDGWRDTDDVAGPGLEIVIGGRYTLLPLEHVRRLRLDPVENPRDTLYRSAIVRLTDDRTFHVFLFGLYTGTADHEEDGIRIGAGVDWVERDDLMRGVGAKTFLFGEEELSLDEFSQVEVR